MAAACEDKMAGGGSLNSPGERVGDAVTLSDSEYLAERPKFLYIGYNSGASGPARSDLVLEGSDGKKATFSVVPGQKVEFRPVRVWSTGSTATVVVIPIY